MSGPMMGAGFKRKLITHRMLGFSRTAGVSRIQQQGTYLFREVHDDVGARGVANHSPAAVVVLRLSRNERVKPQDGHSHRDVTFRERDPAQRFSGAEMKTADGFDVRAGENGRHHSVGVLVC